MIRCRSALADQWLAVRFRLIAVRGLFPPSGRCQRILSFTRKTFQSIALRQLSSQRSIDACPSERRAGAHAARPALSRHLPNPRWLTARQSPSREIAVDPSLCPDGTREWRRGMQASRRYASEPD